MVLTTTKAKPLMEEALNARALRQDLIAGNIANIDTPFYKAIDVDFESALKEKAREMYAKSDIKELEMATTDENHLRGVQRYKYPKSNSFFKRRTHGKKWWQYGWFGYRNNRT